MKDSKYKFYFSILNTIIILAYLLNFDLPKTSYLFEVSVLIFLFCILSFLYIWFKNFLLKLVLNSQVLISIIILFFIFLDLLYIYNSGLFPNALKIWVDKNQKEISIVENIDNNPYIKFKPNKKIRIYKYKGTPDLFKYTWTTDLNGFKNENNLLKDKNIKIIAIGDDMTEGKGVLTSDTFPSILTSKGYPTYNLGVQGYSPSQTLGALKEFGLKMKPEIIISQYTMMRYMRESQKINNNINYGIIEREKESYNLDYRNQAKFIFSGVWLMTYDLREKIKMKIKYFSITLKEKQFKPFINLVNGNLFDFPNNEPNWIATTKIFKEINNIAVKNGAKYILLYIPRMEIIFYERGTKKKLPKSAFKESNLLRKLAVKNNFIYIDTTSELMNYVHNLPLNFDIKDLPLLKDGNLNKIGYEIVSNVIIKHLELKN